MDEPNEVGWHHDPESQDRIRYWNGHEWTGSGSLAPHEMTAVSLNGWRARWYCKIYRNPFVWRPISWLHASVPITRRRMGRFMTPKELRTLPPNR
jgi:hypothetical protein